MAIYPIKSENLNDKQITIGPGNKVASRPVSRFYPMTRAPQLQMKLIGKKIT